MFVQRGGISYSPRCLCARACVCVVSLVILKWQLAFSNRSKSSIHTFPPNFQTRPTHTHSAPKRLPLGAEGVCSKAPKCKLPTRQNHHHHNLLLQLLLKVFVVARVYFKRRNSGAAEIGAEGMLGFYNTAMKNLATHACPHACP